MVKIFHPNPICLWRCMALYYRYGAAGPQPPCPYNHPLPLHVYKYCKYIYQILAPTVSPKIVLLNLYSSRAYPISIRQNHPWYIMHIVFSPPPPDHRHLGYDMPASYHTCNLHILYHMVQKLTSKIVPVPYSYGFFTGLPPSQFQ